VSAWDVYDDSGYALVTRRNDEIKKSILLVAKSVTLNNPMITNRSGDNVRNVHVSKIKVQMTREARRYAKRTVLNHEPCNA
jgi:hypothetical protein